MAYRAPFERKERQSGKSKDVKQIREDMVNQNICLSE